MAYSSAPLVSTYSTKRVPAAYNRSVRNNTVTSYTIGSAMTNLIPMKEQDTIVAETRQPIKAYRITASQLDPRGCYVWEKTTGVIYYFAVCGQGIYTSTDGSTWTAVVSFATNATTRVGFTEFIDGTNTKSLIVVDGVEGYVFTTNAAFTKITDVNFPSPHLPYPVYIDGYLFLAKANTGDIYNSTLNNPLTWPAGSFISSELYPDDLSAIVKINNYLLAIGKLGCEYFYDAANATASPLARYEGASLPFGCSYPDSIAFNKNRVTFLANISSGEMSLMLVEDFKFKDITPPWLISRLNYLLSYDNSKTPEFNGYYMQQKGELIYVLNTCNRNGTLATLPECYAYSFNTNYWINLSTQSDVTSETDKYFPIFYSTFGSTQSVVTFVQGEYRNNSLSFPFFGVMGYCKFSSTAGHFDSFSRDQFRSDAITTNTTNVKTIIQTPEFNFDTLNYKTMSRFGIGWEIVGAVSPITISWEDTSIYTFAVAGNTRVLTLNGTDANDFPFITQLGRFRNRAFKVEVAANIPILFKYFEMDINKGQQ